MTDPEDGPPEATPPAVRVDDYETGQVGCSAIMAGVFLTGVLVDNQHPFWILPLWGLLFAVYRWTASTARVGGCPACGRELRFSSDVAFCAGCCE